MTYKNIAKLIPTLQAIELVKENIKISEKKKKKPEDLVEMGAKNILGTTLIKLQAEMVGGL